MPGSKIAPLDYTYYHGSEIRHTNHIPHCAKSSTPQYENSLRRRSELRVSANSHKYAHLTTQTKVTCTETAGASWLYQPWWLLAWAVFELGTDRVFKYTGELQTYGSSHCPWIIQRYTRERIKHHILQGNLKGGCPITKQPPDAIQIVQAEVSKLPSLFQVFWWLPPQIAARYPILHHYQDNWPSRDMISRYLSKVSKNRY